MTGLVWCEDHTIPEFGNRVGVAVGANNGHEQDDLQINDRTLREF